MTNSEKIIIGTTGKGKHIKFDINQYVNRELEK